MKEFCSATKGVNARSWGRTMVNEFLEAGYLRREKKGFVITRTGKAVYQNYYRSSNERFPRMGGVDPV